MLRIAVTVGPEHARAAVPSVTAALEPSLTLRGLSLQVEVPESAFIHGEAFLLEQALRNLLDNALEFSPAGGTIHISEKTEGVNHIIRVQDSGPGIPDYALSKIFDPFYSLPRPDTQKKSTGLGLSFVRQVAELHGGSIAVGNVEGGCEARLTLPKGKVNVSSK